MANLQKIRDIAKERRISLRDLASQIGVTEAGVYRIIKENSTRVDTLEAIAKSLQVPVAVFFDDTSSECFHGDDLIATNRNLSETVKNLSVVVKNITTMSKNIKNE